VKKEKHRESIVPAIGKPAISSEPVIEKEVPPLEENFTLSAGSCCDDGASD